ncbi:hypothetical protein POTOM_013148 [Populus tomentosa]|uniref:Uncharacterized protein n=1 Tax=Populus tomentosa TaxID=118781 RepID=A0A8X8D6N8_POPTO|nr:hypothetical protein POTOM_013148 [Populus tomentosa]
MSPEVQNQGLFLPILLSTDQSQARQQLVSQNMQNCMASNGVQSYAGLQAALPPVSGVTQTIPNTVVQNRNMQSIPGVSQNSVGNSMGQGIPSTMFVNSQRQMPVEEWLRVHGDHVKSEAVEKAITQIMMGEEAEEMSSGAKKRPGRLLKKVDLLAPISKL